VDEGATVLGLVGIASTILLCLCVWYFFSVLREKPDYHGMARRAIDIPFSNIDLAKVEMQLQRSSHELFRPDGIPERFSVRLRRLERHPKAIQFAKAGSVPIQVYYEVSVMKDHAGDMGHYMTPVWSEEYDYLTGALSMMSSYAKPIQQTPITPPIPAPVSTPESLIAAIQGQIDATERTLEDVRLKKYANQGVTLADVAILEGWAAYLDLLKQRDELMWQGDKKEQTIKSNSDNDG